MENELVFIGENNEAVTDSYKVAEVFGKEHKRVLQDIRELGCSDDFAKHNFVLCLETKQLRVGSTRTKHYQMTKDGFTFLVMGYTGAKAAKFKEAYIAEFNRMERELRRRAEEPQLAPIDTTKYGRKELADMILESDAELGEALAKLEEKTREVAVLKYRLEKKDEEMERLKKSLLPEKPDSEAVAKPAKAPAPVPFGIAEKLDAQEKRIAELERRVECLSRLDVLDAWRTKSAPQPGHPESLFEKYPDSVLVTYPIPTPGEIYQAMTLGDVRRRLWVELRIEISPKSLADYLERIGFIEITDRVKFRPARSAVESALLLAPLAPQADGKGTEVYDPKFTERGFLRLVEIIREKGLGL